MTSRLELGRQLVFGEMLARQARKTPNAEVFVFKDNAYAAVSFFFLGFVPSYPDFLFGLQWVVVQSDSFTIY